MFEKKAKTNLSAFVSESVLDLSKLLIYDFYDYMIPK